MYVSTENRSFIKVREYLQSQYIENNQFMLRLENEELKDLDLDELYNMNENDEERKIMIDAISKECSENVWFFFRELMPIYSHIDIDFYAPGTKISDLPRFILTPLACEMIYMYEQGMNFVVDIESLSMYQRTYVKNIITILAFYEYTFKKGYGVTKYPLHLGDEATVLVESYYASVLNRLITLFLEYTTNGIIGPRDIYKCGDYSYAYSKAIFHVGSIMNDTSSGNSEKVNEYSNIFQYLLETTKDKESKFFGLIDDLSEIHSSEFNKVSHYANEFLFDNIFAKNYIGKNDREVASMIYDNQGEIIPKNKVRIINSSSFTAFIY